MSEIKAEYFIERMDYGEEFAEYSYLYFGCKINNRRILFNPTVTNSADGICVESVSLGEGILICNSEEINAVKKIYDANRYLIAVYYEICVYEHQGYPHPKHILDAVATLPLTPREQSKLQTVIKEYTYIYLIRDRRTGYTKIGRTNEPETRLKTLIRQDTLLPEPNDFYFIFCWADYPYKEKALHRQFAGQRIRGEWFDLSDDDIHEIRSQHFHDKDYFSGKSQDDQYHEDYQKYLDQQSKDGESDSIN